MLDDFPIKRIKRRAKHIYVVGFYQLPKELKLNRSGNVILSVHRSLVSAKRSVIKASWQKLGKTVYSFPISKHSWYWIERHTINK